MFAPVIVCELILRTHPPNDQALKSELFLF